MSGPEACSAFRHGLKLDGYLLVMKDPIARDESEQLDVEFKAAKEAEYLLSVMLGSTEDDTCRDQRGARLPWRTRRPKSLTSMCPMTWPAEKAKWMEKGLPERVFDRRHADDRCYNAVSGATTTSSVLTSRSSLLLWNRRNEGVGTLDLSPSMPSSPPPLAVRAFALTPRPDA